MSYEFEYKLMPVMLSYYVKGKHYKIIVYSVTIMYYGFKMLYKTRQATECISNNYYYSLILYMCHLLS